MAMRRNHKYVNHYNLPILNTWRTNMDITPIISKRFGAAVYMGLYTSKVEKRSSMTEFKEVVKKFKYASENATIKQKMSKIINAVDGARTVSVCEAMSNILGYSHREISCKIKRISTLPYLKFMHSQNRNTSSNGNMNS